MEQIIKWKRHVPEIILITAVVKAYTGNPVKIRKNKQKLNKCYLEV